MTPEASEASSGVSSEEETTPALGQQETAHRTSEAQEECPAIHSGAGLAEAVLLHRQEAVRRTILAIP